MLKTVLHLAKRELFSYFNTPIAYVFLIVFALVSCGLYMTSFFIAELCTMRPFFSMLPLVLIIFVPAITMRLWSDERKSGTIALLFSLPSSSAALTLGKFAAASLFAVMALAGTLPIPIMLEVLGEPDWGPIVGGYAGAVLLACFLVALGLAVSAFFEEQVVSFIITLITGFGCYLAGSDFIASFVDGWIPGLGTFLKETLGLPNHFSTFAKGVLDLSDALYFVLFTASFLLINVFTLEGRLRMRTSRGFFPGVALLIGVVVFANGLLHDMSGARVDLTEERIFSVSPATKRVFEKLQVPITVTYYVSSKDRLPTPMKEMARDVRDILEELARLSPKFRYRIVDPASIPDRIKDLEKKGIMPFAAQTIEKDSLNLKRIYSAIEVAYLDKKEEVIPQVVPDTLGNLEYQLVSKIFRLTLDHKPKVVLVTPAQAPDPAIAMLMKRMGRDVGENDRFQGVAMLLESEGYQVVKQQIDKEHPIPEDADLLVLLAPGELSERQQYEVLAFLRSGRPMLLAAQQYRFNYTEGREGMMAIPDKLTSGANALLEGLGVKVSDRLLFDANHMVLTVTSRRGMGLFTALVQTPVNFPMQIKVTGDQMNKELSLTNRVASLLYLWGSALEFDSGKLDSLGIQHQVLFSTSPQSWEREYHFGPLRQADLAPSKPDELKKRPLALLLTGTFPDWFGGKPPAWPGEDESNATSTDTGPKSPKEARIVVLGCAEMFSDTALPAVDNAVFFLNTVDALTLGNELINIRSKRHAQRFIRPVTAGERLMWRALVTGTTPLCWSLFGLAWLARRRKRRASCA